MKVVCSTIDALSPRTLGSRNSMLLHFLRIV
jgi:hypothetical protein